MKNRCMKDKSEKKLPFITGMTRFQNPIYASIMAASGYDCVCIDNEHFPFNDNSITAIVNAVHDIGRSCTIRISKKSTSSIYRLLDTGVDGIYVPNVETKEEVKMIVDACKYPPQGKRGCCPISIDSDFGIGYTSNIHYEKSNEDISISIMIESKKGYENLEDILNVEGIDVIAIGPSDFSGSYGCPGNTNDPIIKNAMDDVYVKARAHGIICETSVSNIQDVKNGLAKNDVCLYCDSDLQMLIKTIKNKYIKNQTNIIVLSIADPSAAEIAVLCGVEYIVIDYSFIHDEKDIIDMIHAIHSRRGKAIVLVNDKLDSNIVRLLDFGFDGVISNDFYSLRDVTIARLSLHDYLEDKLFIYKNSHIIMPQPLQYSSVHKDFLFLSRINNVDFHILHNSVSYELVNHSINLIGYDSLILEEAFRKYVSSIREAI